MSEKNYSVRKITTLFRKDWIHIDEAELDVKMFNGKEMRIRRYSMNPPEVVGVLLWHVEEESFLLVKQFRYSTINIDDGFPVEIVAGVVESKDESLELTAIRECEEETGYRPGSLQKISGYLPNLGLSNQVVHLFYGEVDDSYKISSGGGLEHEGEDIQLIKASLSDMYSDLISGNIIDSKTLIAVQWFFLQFPDKLQTAQSRAKT